MLARDKGRTQVAEVRERSPQQGETVALNT